MDGGGVDMAPGYLIKWGKTTTPAEHKQICDELVEEEKEE